MKRLWFVLSLMLVPVVALATDPVSDPVQSGIRPATSTTLGAIKIGSGLAMSATNVLSATGTVSGGAGGANGQLQYNNSGVLGGFTMSGDATLVPATGLITLTNTPATRTNLGLGIASAVTFLGVTATSFDTPATSGAYKIGGTTVFQLPPTDTTGMAIGAEAYSLAPASASAYGNIAIGYLAMGSATATKTDAFISNTAVGAYALRDITSGLQNAAVGYQALRNNNTGKYNTAVGNAAGRLITSGQSNTAMGAYALPAATTTYSNTAVGYNAFGSLTGGPNTAVGAFAGRYVTTGANNTAVGQMALFGGSSTNQVTGSNNTVIGDNAGASAITTFANNTLLGYKAGYTLTTGGSNVIIGPSVGSTTLTTGSNNILIGNSSAVDTPSASTSNFLNIGNTITTTGLGTATAATNVVGSIIAGDHLVGTTATIPQMVYTGNSIIYGLTSTSPDNYVTLPNWRSIAMTSTNIAVSGQYVSTSFQNAPYALHPMYRRESAANLVLIMGGHPEFGVQSADQTCAEKLAYAKSVEDRGWKAIVMTEVTGSPPSYETWRIAHNKCLRENWPKYATNIADAGADMYLGYSATNTTYFNADAIHLTATGEKRLGEAVLQPAIEQIITKNASKLGPVYPTYDTTSLSVGFHALIAQTGTSQNNFALGNNAGATLTSGINNVIIGNNVASTTLASGSNNILMGTSSLVDATLENTNNSVAIGGKAGTYDTVVGINALGSTATNGQANSAYGYNSLHATTTGTRNTALGYSAMGSNINGSYNVAVGQSALNYALSAGNNVAIGAYAMFSTSATATALTGSNNTVVGYGSMYAAQTTANANTTLGSKTGYAITTGAGNTIIGSEVASTTLTTGSNNILIGTSSAVTAPSASTSNWMNIGNILYGDTSLKNLIVNSSSVATNATDGFLYIPLATGTPSGTPTAYSGRVPLVYDSTNNKLCVFNSTWRCAAH